MGISCSTADALRAARFEGLTLRGSDFFGREQARFALERSRRVTRRTGATAEDACLAAPTTPRCGLALIWGEVRRRRGDIERYAYSALHFDGGAGNACAIKPVRHLIDEHADGSYAALFFDVQCAHAPRRLSVDYRIFFAIDPSHRGILVVHDGADIATAVLSPANSRIDLMR